MLSQQIKDWVCQGPRPVKEAKAQKFRTYVRIILISYEFFWPFQTVYFSFQCRLKVN